jgi:hypothetical protein
MNTFIYSLSDPITDEVRYIGKANNIKARYKDHICIRKKGDTSHRRNWIASLKLNGLLPKLEVIDEVKHEEWEFWERHYISLYKSWGFSLTNHQLGGGQCRDFSKCTAETKLKMRNAQLGRKHSDEAKEKQRIKQIGVRISDEAKERLRIVNKGKKMSPEAIAKTVAAKEKPVIQFDLITGEKIAEYDSARKAMRALGGKGFNLTNHLKGNRRSYMGFRFEYKNKE